MRGKVLGILGTDTGVGKTFVSAVVALALRRRGVVAGIVKPVASGGVPVKGRLVSEDAIWLKRMVGMSEESWEINPVCYRHPLAPAVAARLERRRLSVGKVLGLVEEWRRRYSFVLAEGVGGVLVPLGRGYTVADLFSEIRAEILLVARAGLGTVNHSLLTIEALRRRGLRIRGLLLNGATGSDISERHNAGTIERESGVKVVAVLPRIAGPSRRRVAALAHRLPDRVMRVLAGGIKRAR